MQQGVVLFFVLNDTKKTKKVLQVLKERRVEQYTVLNTFGSYGLYHHGHVNYAPSVAGGMNSSKELDERRYNKTFLIPVPSEEEAVAVMQRLAEVTGVQEGTGNGILFTVPMAATVDIKVGNSCGAE